MLTWLSRTIDDIWGDDDDDEDDDDEDRNENGEPDWVQSERDQFTNYRDKNQDGQLDTDEIREWIIPEDYDHSSAEAIHLIKASDKDGVGRKKKGIFIPIYRSVKLDVSYH